MESTNLTPTSTDNNVKGFHKMSKERQREVASAGGKAAHAKGTAHKWDKDAARAASLKSHENRKAKKLAALNGGGSTV